MANPETCLHRVIQIGITNENERIVVCVSCDTKLDPDELVKRGSGFEYDIDYNVWVYIPLGKKTGTKEEIARRVERAQELRAELGIEFDPS